MDLHHLKIFYVTCQEKSFTKAAKKLFISQSAVSIQIKKLEESVNITLIERTSKNFKLTYAGRELYNLSKEIFSKISRMENEMKKILETNKSKIVIGATHNIGEPVLPKIITEYSKINDNVEFDIYIKNSNSLLKYLKDGTIDIAIMEEELLLDNDFNIIKTDNYPFVLIAPASVRTIEDIKKLTLLKKDTPITSKYLETLEEMIDFNFNKKMIVNGSNETIKNLVIDEMGLSVLPYYCVYQEITENLMQLIHTFDNFDNKLQIVFLKENENKPIIKNFLVFLKNYNIKNELNLNKSILKK